MSVDECGPLLCQVEISLIGGMVRVTHMLKMAEISSGRSLKYIPREPKSGYVIWLQMLKKTFGNAVGGIGLSKLQSHDLWCCVQTFP